MEDEHHGTVDDPRHGQQPEAPSDARGIQEADDAGVPSKAGGEGAAVPHGREEDSLRIEDAIREIVSVSMEWAGPLPTPGSLSKYEPDVQDKIIEWADRKVTAMCDDESRRQDKLVDAEIRQGRNGQIASTVIMLSALVLAAVVGIVTGDAVMSGAFLILPFATIIGNLFKPIRTSKKNTDE